MAIIGEGLTVMKTVDKTPPIDQASKVVQVTGVLDKASEERLNTVHEYRRRFADVLSQKGVLLQASIDAGGRPSMYAYSTKSAPIQPPDNIHILVNEKSYGGPVRLATFTNNQVVLEIGANNTGSVDIASSIIFDLGTFRIYILDGSFSKVASVSKSIKTKEKHRLSPEIVGDLIQLLISTSKRKGITIAIADPE